MGDPVCWIDHPGRQRHDLDTLAIQDDQSLDIEIHAVAGVAGFDQRHTGRERINPVAAQGVGNRE